MPKIKWIKAPVQVNYLAAVFREYRKARGMSSVEIAEAVGCSPQNARVQMSKPGRAWNIGQLLRYCDALGIPYEVALEAAAK